MSIRAGLFVLFLGAAAVSTAVLAQPPGMGGEDRELLDQFDTDDNGWLDNEERVQARAFIKENPARGRGFGGPGRPGGPGGFGGPGFGPPPEFGPPRERERGERNGRDEAGPARGFPGRGGFGPPEGRGPEGRGPGGRGPEGRGPGGRGPEGRGPGGPGFDRGGPGGPGFGRRGPGGPGGRGPGGRGPGGRGPGANRPEASEGAKIDKASVTPLQGELYDRSVLRTIFIDFENSDWESELEDFHGTDIDVAATLIVDGKTYPNCGIRFRGASSYGMVPAGYKRSLNVSMDMADADQRLLGYKTLNLLNGSGDESMLSTVLYSHIARQYIAAPKANFVRVVINGENWGIYTNVQQFNKEFLKENYDSSKGARWKVSGSPRGGGGLDYRGEDPANYQHPYEQKSGGKDSLAKLIELCRVLEETPTESLSNELEAICDVDELLWFLAIDNGLINSDGYWVRASDYSIFLDKNDKFHFIPHDMNEAFRGAGGPGMRGPGGPRGPAGRAPGRGGPGGRGPGGGGPGGERPRDDRPQGEGPRGEEARGEEARGEEARGEEARGEGPPRGGPSAMAGSPVELDPLIGLDDPSKPLRSKVLAVEKYREQYLHNIRELAEKSLDWDSLGPVVAQAVSLIDEEVKTETRKLGSYEAFVAATSEAETGQGEMPRGHAMPRGHGAMNIKAFAEARSDYLLNKEVK